MKINWIRIKDQCHQRLNILLKNFKFSWGSCFQLLFEQEQAFEFCFPCQFIFCHFFHRSLHFFPPTSFNLLLPLNSSRERWIFQSDERKRLLAANWWYQQTSVSHFIWWSFFPKWQSIFFWWKLVKFFCKATIRSDVLSNTRKHQQSDNDEQKCNFTLTVNNNNLV